MDRFSFYKELYFKEFDRRDNLNKEITNNITIITAFVAVTYFLFTNFKFTCTYYVTVLFNIFIAASFVMILISVFFLIKAYHNWFSGFDYSYLPFTNDLEEYYQSIRQYEIYYRDEKVSDEELNDNIHQQYENNIIENYLVRYSDDNSFQNGTKSRNIHISKTFIIFSFVFLLLSLIPFIFNYISVTVIKNQ